MPTVDEIRVPSFDQEIVQINPTRGETEDHKRKRDNIDTLRVDVPSESPQIGGPLPLPISTNQEILHRLSPSGMDKYDVKPDNPIKKTRP